MSHPVKLINTYQTFIFVVFPDYANNIEPFYDK